MINLRILHVEERDQEVLVDLYGGPNNSVISIRYFYADNDLRAKFRQHCIQRMDSNMPLRVVKNMLGRNLIVAMDDALNMIGGNAPSQIRGEGSK